MNKFPIFITHEIKLSAEIYTVLRHRELLIPKYKGSSKCLCYRRVLVDWLAIISEQLKLSHGILHIAVALFDITLDKYDDFKGYPTLQLCALCCLWIAAKLDERDDLIPRVSTLQTVLTEKNFFHEDILSMELSIMQVLDWRLMIPTSVQFFDYYMQDVISEGDLHTGYAITNIERARVYIRKYVKYFLGVVLQDHIFNAYLPSQITSAAIAASRLCLNISPTWPRHLCEKTGYDYTDVEECISRLLKHHEEDQGRCKRNS